MHGNRMLSNIPNDLLIETYYRAKELNLGTEFITIFAEEMKSRGLLEAVLLEKHG